MAEAVLVGWGAGDRWEHSVLLSFACELNTVLKKKREADVICLE